MTTSTTGSTSSSTASLAGSGTMSSPGIGSGLDVNGIVSKLMAIERQPIDQIATEVTADQAKLTAYGTLKGAVSSFETAVKALTNPATFSATKATVADPTVFTAASDATATAGDYNVEVVQLAQAQKLQSAAFANTTDSVGDGTLTFDFGTYASGGFTTNPDKKSVTVTIPSGGGSLTAIAQAINSAHAGINAAVINDGTSNYLQFSPVNQGTANSLRISVADSDGNNTDNAGLSQLAYDASSGGVKNLTEKVAAQDSVIRVDGTQITKSSNVIDDAISGVTFNLLKTSTGAVLNPSPTTPDTSTPTTMSIARDTSGLSGTINTMVTAYNSLQSMLGNLLSYNASTGQAGALQSEGTVRSIQAEVNRAMQSMGKAGGISSLSELGVSFQRDGSLSFDATKLQTALTDTTKNIATFFIGQNNTDGTTTPGFATQLDGLLNSMLSSSGMLTARTDGINTEITDYNSQSAELETRMTAIEARYRAQYSALDTLISSMNSTSSSLTQELASLPTIGTTKSG